MRKEDRPPGYRRATESEIERHRACLWCKHIVCMREYYCCELIGLKREYEVHILSRCDRGRTRGRKTMKMAFLRNEEGRNGKRGE